MRKGSSLKPIFYFSDQESKTFRESDLKLFKMQKDRYEVNCAFHPNEKITNFCKNSECLLPLCPKCIKIHTQEHAQLGTFSTFQSIDECLEEVHQTYMTLFSDVSRLQRASFEIEQSYKKKKEQTLEQFQKSKKLAQDYLNSIFNQYQDAINIQLSKDERIFTQGLIRYHDYIGKVMEKCRVGTKKLQNKHLLMEGIISFYMEQQLREELKKCQEELDAYSIKKLEIYAYDHQLENMEQVIKNYLKFGNNDNKIENLRIGAQMERQASFFGARDTERFSSFENQNNKSMEATLQKSHLNSLQSPLDKFSLERSRSIRMNLSHRK